MSQNVKPWLSLKDVEAMYDSLNGPQSLKRSFLAKAKKLARKAPLSDTYIFIDEIALFDLFKKELPVQIAGRKIKYFGELIQLIS